MERRTFVYDENLDRLVVFNTLDKDDKIYGSVNIFNLVIDFTTRNKIANIEIMNVSEYLQSLNINPNILQRLDESQIILKQMRGGFLLTVLLRFDNKSVTVPFSLPAEDKAVITV